MDKIRIEVLKRDPKAIVPHRLRDTDAGYDIHSLVYAEIHPGGILDIDTGMAVVAPAGTYFTVEGRSSLFRAGVVPFRGIIDATYTGNITVTLMNVGKSIYHIYNGDRIAQLVPHKIISLDFDEVTEISPEYNVRGNNGYGSSGR